MTRKLLLVAAMALWLSAGTPTYADVMYSGDAYGLSVPGILPPVADTGPLPPGGGTLSNGVPSFNFLGVVTTGAINNTTMGVGGVASSHSNILTFHSDLTSQGIPLVVTIGTIDATSSANGNSMPPVVMGTTTLTNAMATFNGVPINIPMNPAPNTVIDLGGGNTITLNEQTSMVTNDSGEISVTAIHGHLASGIDVFIAHAESDISNPAPAPEPGTLTLAGVGLFGLACFTFRRRNGPPGGRGPTNSPGKAAFRGGPGYCG
jgi:hypothetical protein